MWMSQSEMDDGVPMYYMPIASIAPPLYREADTDHHPVKEKDEKKAQEEKDQPNPDDVPKQKEKVRSLVCPCTWCFWLVWGVVGFSISCCCTLFTLWSTRQLAEVCSWWTAVVVVLIVFCIAVPIIAIMGCLFGIGGPIAKKRKTSRRTTIVVGCSSCILTAILVLAQILLAVAFLYFTTGHRIPTHVPGMHDEVSIEYDPYGVPHIHASDAHDAFMAMGLVHARHRLWQMEVQRRMASGTLSEVLGASSINLDKQMRIMGLYVAAERAYPLLSAKAKDAVDAYTAGINAYVDSNPHIPLEYLFFGFSPSHWTSIDALAWQKVMSFQLSTDMDAMLVRWRFVTEQGLSYERAMELYPRYNRTWQLTALSTDDLIRGGVPLGVVEPSSAIDSPEIIEFVNSFRGACPTPSGPRPKIPPYDYDQLRHGPSNNFVVSGAHTGEGIGPILANDPHLYLTAPGVWFAIHIEVRGVAQAIGASFPGVPGVVVGRNEHIAWGVTTTACDVQDLYALRLAPGGYVYDGQTLPFVLRTETIAIKDADPYILTVRLTQDGMPVLDEPFLSCTARPLALKWPAVDPSVNDTTVESMLTLTFATDWTSFRSALRGFVGPIHNFVFAATDGDIAYIMPGRVPQRPAGMSGSWPVPGDDSRFAWKPSYVPYDSLPQTLNPDKGFIVTANNQITPEGYEKAGCNMYGEYLMHYRAERITDLLSSMIQTGHRIAPGDMRTIQLDFKTYQFEDLIPAIAALPESVLGSVASEWRQKLLVWDGVTSVGSLEASIYGAWILELQRMDQNETGLPQWGDWSTAWAHIRAVLLEGEPDPGCNGDCLAFAARALNTAVVRVPPGTEWGVSVHRARFDHLVMSSAPSYLACVFNRDVPHGGDCNTVNAGSYEDTDEMPMRVGPSYRQIVSMGSPDDASTYLVPPGQDGSPLSKHYDDMLVPYAEGDFITMTMRGYKVTRTVRLYPK